MYYFAVFLFFALGVMALTMLGGSAYRRFSEGRAFMAGATGVALAWLTNFNMWTGWHITDLRYNWVGITMTGVALAGTALLFHSVFGFFAGLYRKFEDQAQVIEHAELHRVA